MKKKLNKTGLGSSFLGSIFSNRDKEESQINLEEKDNLSILKDI